MWESFRKQQYSTTVIAAVLIQNCYYIIVFWSALCFSLAVSTSLTDTRAHNMYTHTHTYTEHDVTDKKNHRHYAAVCSLYTVLKHLGKRECRLFQAAWNFEKKCHVGPRPSWRVWKRLDNGQQSAELKTSMEKEWPEASIKLTRNKFECSSCMSTLR